MFSSMWVCAHIYKGARECRGVGSLTSSSESPDRDSGDESVCSKRMVFSAAEPHLQPLSTFILNVLKGHLVTFQ